MKKKLLVVVDYQNDFVNGALGFEKAKQMENALEVKILDYIFYHHDVVFTLDTHHDNYLDTREGEMLPTKHCIEGTEGHEVYGKIFKYSRMFPNIKKDAFGAKDLVYFFVGKEYEEIEIVGVVSNMCVLANAIICQAANPNAKIIINKDLVASFDEETEKKCFDVMEKLFMEVK